MLALRDLQTTFRLALLNEKEDALQTLVAQIAGGGDLAADERIAVYRNNVFASLTDALKETFPVVCRLVDERFFSYAAHEFIAAHPPARPSLVEYGNAFPEFLASFPACQELVYLPEVARFEWLLNVAAHAPDGEAASAEALAGIAPDDAARLMFSFQPCYRYFTSRFPVDRIWRANQMGGCAEGTIDLEAGGVHLEVSRQDGDVVFRTLDAGNFAFRQDLANGAALGEAIGRTLAIAPEFSIGEALAELFREGAVSAITLGASTEPP